MKVRSTGLGKQQLIANIEEISLMKQDSLIMRIKSNEPVVWQIRIVMGHDDLLKFLPQLLKPANLFGVLKLIFFKRGDCKPEGDW